MSTTDLLRAGETLTTEFKTHLNDRDLTKAIACGKASISAPMLYLTIPARSPGGSGTRSQ